MGISQRQLVQECFDGERRRNCDYCPGHYSKKGICCYGQKYEDHDAQCHACPHSVECEPATFQYVTMNEEEEHYEQRPNITLPRRHPARPMTHNRRTPVHDQAKEPIMSRGSSRNLDIAEPNRFHDKSFFEQIGIHALWGAMEGALEMVLGFFRNRRPD